MKKIIPVFCLAALLFMTSSCQKDDENNNSKSNTQLLTDRPWKLLNYGLDYNNDKYISPSEEAILACEKDNTYIFSPDGTGVASENAQICTGNPASNSFDWLFTNNETGLDFEFGAVLLINKLTTDTMRLMEDNSGPNLLILTYTH